MSLNAPELHASSDVREPISLHWAVSEIFLLFRVAMTFDLIPSLPPPPLFFQEVLEAVDHRNLDKDVAFFAENVR